MKVIAGPFSSLPTEIGQELSKNSLLNSPGFLSLWKTMGGEPRYWTVLDAEDRVILTVGSVDFRKFMRRSLQLLADGLYFRPAFQKFPDSVLRQGQERLWRELCASRYWRVHLVDFDNALDNLDAAELIECETLVALIDSPDWLPPDKKLQSEMRKAEREKINVQRFDGDKHFDRFMALMSQTESRHNRRPKYNDQFFQALARLSESDSRVDWTIVEVDGQLAASHINLVEGNMLINWQVYYDKNFSWLKPNQYLLIEAIHRGWHRGVRQVNFGATPKTADGVRVYKEKWGGRPHRYRTLVNRKGLGWIR